MSLEIWKPVVGYEGLYEVSNLGRVRSLTRLETYFSRTLGECLRTSKGRILRPSPTRDGYLLVVLYRSGKQKYVYVHRLVMAAFVGACPSELQINHKDENTFNNCLENLEYCTQLYNNNYGNHRVHMSQSKGRPVECIDATGTIRRFRSMKDASAETGAFASAISACCRGVVHTANGYTWRYAQRQMEV